MKIPLIAVSTFSIRAISNVSAYSPAFSVGTFRRGRFYKTYATRQTARHQSTIDGSAGGESSVTRISESLVATGTGTGLLPNINSIKGIIFDMDGTLIQPSIDFPELRRRVHELADTDPLLRDEPEEVRRGDVLNMHNTFSPKGQALVQEVFDDIEEMALRGMTLMDNCGDLCHFLDERGIPRAVLTRNVERSVGVMQKKLWETSNVKGFFPTVNRNTVGMNGKALEIKPSPDSIYHICSIWGCDPKDVLMVGDSVSDDIVAANRAGCGGSVLLNFKGRKWDNDSGGRGTDGMGEDQLKEREPTIVIHDLGDLQQILVE
uniref:Phosphoglycolate phosphatase n=1 Tax=Chaetoceros debilis TaxID=122233 RepID=A0A7S3QG91_9STRA|mmetsp:Transcript_16365/g.24574  ORF Transcript_16365/g.24574 Transcript_16365/m.24574 type:complete len:319 (-) Transcript_16365:322-1278(-)|eukprot:CAMPEP_0194087092 /NCGR_PEP_ID=MMETSP0149-20130528/23816_1 /TAXON_ID=122233 /ORGANISM="Chaetoceros debilis, Strain MM31A-1" /LENGTH=318 /DNA_ID=CAMNT_0038770361 /DNA_START=159 /DNA_END=1115 /DNA_ORIENTATION=-